MKNKVKKRVTKSKKKIIFMILLGINLVLLSAVLLQLGLQKPYITDEELMEYFEITKESSDISQYLETSSKEEHVALSDSAKQLLTENGFKEEEINEIGHLVYTGTDLEFLEEILSTDYAKAFQRKPRTLSTGMTFFLVSYLEKLTGSAKGEEVNAFYNALLSGGANLEEDISYYQTARRARQYLQWLECGAEAKLILNGNKMKLAVKEENKEATETLYHLQGGYYKDYCMSRTLLCFDSYFHKEVGEQSLLYQLEALRLEALRKDYTEFNISQYQVEISAYSKKRGVIETIPIEFEINRQYPLYLNSEVIVYNEIEKEKYEKGIQYCFINAEVSITKKQMKLLVAYDNYGPQENLKKIFLGVYGFSAFLSKQEQKICDEVVRDLQSENIENTDSYSILYGDAALSSTKREELVKLIQGGCEEEIFISDSLSFDRDLQTIEDLIINKVDKENYNIDLMDIYQDALVNNLYTIWDRS